MKPLMKYFCLALLATASLVVPASAEGEEISKIVPFDCKIEQEDGYGPVIFIKTSSGWNSPEPSAFKNIQETKNGFAFELSDFERSLGFITKERGDTWSLKLLTEQESATGTCYDKTRLVNQLKGPLNQLAIRERDALIQQVKNLEEKNAALEASTRRLAAVALKNPRRIGAFSSAYGYSELDVNLEEYKFREQVAPDCLSQFLRPTSVIGKVCLEDLRNNLLPKK